MPTVNRIHFYDLIRQSLFGGKLTAKQVQGIEAIIDEYSLRAAHMQDLRWLAYILATTFHETGKTMAPVEEIGKGRGHDYGQHLKLSRKPYSTKLPLYYGRGMVQLSWYENYELAGKKLGIDLLNHPELALDLNISTKILFSGMIEGWFTGKKLQDYFSAEKEDWANARRIINGTDKAELVADYAKKFYEALRG